MEATLFRSVQTRRARSQARNETQPEVREHRELPTPTVTLSLRHWHGGGRLADQTQYSLSSWSRSSDKNMTDTGPPHKPQ